MDREGTVETTPQGLIINSVTNPITDQVIKYVFAVWIARGCHKGHHSFMPYIHPATTKDGLIYDMEPGELYPITLDKYHIAVESRQFCVPHLHKPGDNLLRDALRTLWAEPKTINGDILYQYVEQVGGFLQPLNNINGQAWDDTILPAPKG